MTAPVLYLHSGDGSPSPTFNAALEAGDLRWLRQTDVTAADFEGIRGLILPHAIDQIALMEMQPVLEAFLDSGGRLAMHCHVLRKFIDGLEIYIPMERPKRADFNLYRLKDHPIFDGLDPIAFEANKGVAGFYGRVHNPMPAGAEAIQVFGEKAVPVDWEWQRPRGGVVFSHAGNDLWVVGDDRDMRAGMGSRIVNWCKGEA